MYPGTSASITITGFTGLSPLPSPSSSSSPSSAGTHLGETSWPELSSAAAVICRGCHLSRLSPAAAVTCRGCHMSPPPSAGGRVSTGKWAGWRRRSPISRGDDCRGAGKTQPRRPDGVRDGWFDRRRPGATSHEPPRPLTGPLLPPTVTNGRHNTLMDATGCRSTSPYSLHFCSV